MYLNKAIITGNLTRDPELKSLPSGTKVCNFSIATNRVWTQDGEKKEEVQYHTIVVFGRQAETSAQYLKKGSQAMVEGRLQTQSWDDAESGKKMYRTEIVADRVQFGARPKADGVPAEVPVNQAYNGPHNPDGSIDLSPQGEVDPSQVPLDEIDFTA